MCGGCGRLGVGKGAVMVRDQGRDPQGRGDSERGECVEGQMGGLRK